MKEVAANWFGGLVGAAKRPSDKHRGKPRRASLRAGAISTDAVEARELDAARMAADAGLSAIASALADADPAVRIRSLAIIGELSAQGASRLLRAMIHDPDSAVRSAAIATAAQVGTTSVVASLIVALEDPEADVRRAAAHAIAKVCGQAVLPEDTDFRVSSARIAELKAWWKEERFRELCP